MKNDFEIDYIVILSKDSTGIRSSCHNSKMNDEIYHFVNYDTIISNKMKGKNNATNKSKQKR